MINMLILIVVLVFLIMFLLVYSLLANYAPQKEGCGIRLQSLEKMTIGGDVSVREKPTKTSGGGWRGMAAFDRWCTHLGRLFPPTVRQATENKLAAAGGIGQMDADQCLGCIALLSVSAPVTVAALGGGGRRTSCQDSGHFWHPLCDLPDSPRSACKPKDS